MSTYCSSAQLHRFWQYGPG